MLSRCSRLFTSSHAASNARRAVVSMSGNRAKFRVETEYGMSVVKGNSEAARFMNESHNVQKYPGSRFVELMKPHLGNPLSYEVMQKLTNDFLLLEENHAVNAVLFGTNNEFGDAFSTGLCEKALKIDRQRTLQELYNLCRLFSTYKRDFITISGCKMPGTVLGLNLNAKYRLGAPSLQCVVNELTRGYVPGGGLAHHFSHKAGLPGQIMSRYLAYSQRTVQAADLHSMGLLTHLVMENPHFLFCDALGHSIGSVSQSYQQLPGHQDATALLLDTMHVGDPEEMEDPLEDPYWDTIMLIKGDKLNFDKIKHHASDIERFYDAVAACFNAKSLEEAVKRVATAAPSELHTPPPFGAERSMDFVDNYHWASEALLSLEQCDPLAAKAWYKLTEITSNPKLPLKEALQLEMHVNMGLMNGRIPRLLSQQPVQRGVGSFNREDVVKGIAARLATVSDADVNALFANSPVDLSKFK